MSSGSIFYTQLEYLRKAKTKVINMAWCAETVNVGIGYGPFDIASPFKKCSKIYDTIFKKLSALFCVLQFVCDYSFKRKLSQWSNLSTSALKLPNETEVFLLLYQRSQNGIHLMTKWCSFAYWYTAHHLVLFARILIFWDNLFHWLPERTACDAVKDSLELYRRPRSIAYADFCFFNCWIRSPVLRNE